MNIETRLHELDLRLPAPPEPGGNDQPWLIAGNLLFVSGQFPIENGQLRYTGQVGADLTEAHGYAACLAALNVLAKRGRHTRAGFTHARLPLNLALDSS